MKKRQIGFGIIEILLILVLLGVLGYAGWYVYHSKNNVTNNYNNAANSSDVVKNSEDTSAKKEPPATTPSSQVTISDSLKENTAAAIESKNTAALEGYMTSMVTVVIAASEKGGSETAYAAVMDLDYLKSGTMPWNFTLPSATLTIYKNGFYGQYFGNNTIVGQSANNYVVSFGVNADGKIDTVFMAANADMLQE